MREQRSSSTPGRLRSLVEGDATPATSSARGLASSGHVAVSRRDLLRGATAGVLLAGSTSATAIGGSVVPIVRTARRAGGHANGRLGVGVIGYGIRARNLIGRFLAAENVEVVAIAEPIGARRAAGVARIREARPDAEPLAFADWRSLVSHPSVDAVFIATPDHWHALMAIAACGVGRHVYCEKPLSRTVAEGRAIADAARTAGVVFQTGSQQRSEYGEHFIRAAEAVRNGRIGSIERIAVGVGDPPIDCDLPAEDLPDDVTEAAWTAWNGPSPTRPFNSVLCPVGMHGHYPRWRDYREYAGGGLADMGAHHFDIAQWALRMDRSGPRGVVPPTSPEAKRGLEFVYADGTVMRHEGDVDVRFEGTDGWIEANRGSLSASEPEVLEAPLRIDEEVLPRPKDHVRNFLDAIEHGTPVAADAETGHRTATICQLAAIGYRMRTPLSWNPVTERFEGAHAAEANEQLADPANPAWLARLEEG